MLEDKSNELKKKVVNKYIKVTNVDKSEMQCGKSEEEIKIKIE